MPSLPNYYEILGVPRDASQEQIKAQYIRLAKELHPDRRQGDPIGEDRLKQVNAANQVLSDIDRRQAYDRQWEIHLAANHNSLASIRQRHARSRYEAAPTRVPVRSSIFRSLSYDPYEQKLEVEFLTGAIFQYQGVPDTVYAEFLKTDKKGTFYRTRIVSIYPERCLR